MNRGVGATLLLLAVVGCFSGLTWHTSWVAYLLLPLSVLLGGAGALLLGKQPSPPLTVEEPLTTPEPHSNLRVIPPVS